MWQRERLAITATIQNFRDLLQYGMVSHWLPRFAWVVCYSQHLRHTHTDIYIYMCVGIYVYTCIYIHYAKYIPWKTPPTHKAMGSYSTPPKFPGDNGDKLAFSVCSSRISAKPIHGWPYLVTKADFFFNGPHLVVKNLKDQESLSEENFMFVSSLVWAAYPWTLEAETK